MTPAVWCTLLAIWEGRHCLSAIYRGVTLLDEELAVATTAALDWAIAFALYVHGQVAHAMNQDDLAAV